MQAECFGLSKYCDYSEVATAKRYFSSTTLVPGSECLACDSDSCARSRWQFVHCRKIWGTMEGSCKLVHLPISQILLSNSLYGCLMLPAFDGLTSKCRSWRTCRPSSLGPRHVPTSALYSSLICAITLYLSPHPSSNFPCLRRDYPRLCRRSLSAYAPLASLPVTRASEGASPRPPLAVTLSVS